jgi:hypothetical protein
VQRLDCTAEATLEALLPCICLRRALDVQLLQFLGFRLFNFEVLDLSTQALDLRLQGELVSSSLSTNISYQ